MVLKIVCKSINKMFLEASDILATGHLAVWRFTPGKPALTHLDVGSATRHLAVWSVQHRCLRIHPWETSINTSGCWLSYRTPCSVECSA